ncbi:hypothetical protein O181_076274 [Austropuccinia psidii MF-1]|uniref:Integrase catalytic domain-containing protein n=1 Tax=Austropuccinia psidii MF-1 TaxID=1389203 RepID=A0A9Q3IF91_9BASI|nr:hypothetical protein [Austropuccinia psidii MF-1]
MNEKSLDIKDISTIPILDGTNYGHWQMRMKIHLRSRDLLEVCEKSIASDASTSAVNKWTKASFEAINLITTRITERVFREVINSETIENSRELWSKIAEQYASKQAVNRGRVWMDWQRCFYDGNLQNYIDTCRKLMMEPDAVSILVPNELLSYSLLGKLGGNSNLSQFVENLIFNEDIIEKSLLILSRLQDFANHNHHSPDRNESTSTALTTLSDEPHKIVFYCGNGKHNRKCTTHKREECWAENPHLRPSRKDKKRKNNPSAHLSIVQALITLSESTHPTSDQVVIDCGATHHMFNNTKFFSNQPRSVRSEVATGDSQSHLIATGIGKVTLICNGKTLNLENCLLVPGLKCNLISMLELFKNQLTVNRQEKTFSLTSKQEVLLTGEIINRLMYINYELPTVFLTIAEKHPWHNRLGHPGPAVLKTLGLPNIETSCHICEISKIHRLPFNHHFDPAQNPMDSIHIDLVGPITPASLSGFKYLLTIVDQSSSFKIMKFLKKKSESFDQFVIAKNFMETQQNKKMKKLTSDRGGEFVNEKFKKLAEDCGFTHILSPPNTPEHNGYAKRCNRTILEKARCLMSMANLPNHYWAEAVNTAVFLSNLSPTPSRGNKSPYQLWNNLLPRLSRLRTFGCHAVIYNLKNQRDWKLAPPGQEGLLLGFENKNTSYRILRLADLKVVITRNAIFNENIFPRVLGGRSNTPWTVTETSNHQLKQATKNVVPSAVEPDLFSPIINCSESTETTDQILTHTDDLPEETAFEEADTAYTQTEAENICNNEHPVNRQQTSNNDRTPKLKVIGPRHPTLITSNVDPLHILPYTRRPRSYFTVSEETPKTYSGALKSDNRSAWVNAIEKELANMDRLKVWNVIDCKKEHRLIGTTWVFKVKKNHLNQVIERKARLCAQGFRQTLGVDFDKTYAPTGRLNSLRALIAHACLNKLDFHQVDIKSAFLNAPLNEAVYLSIPQGLAIDRRQYCLRLNKGIYGLKQAPLAWYTRLQEWLQKAGFTACKLDPCVFYRNSPEKVWIYVHVDDIAIFGNNLHTFKKEIDDEFEIKDMGPANLLLGVKISQLEGGIGMDQQHFVESLLEVYGMQDCKPVSTPLVPNEHLGPATEEERTAFESLQINFRSAVGSINYLSTATRPDLSFAVSSLSQYLEKPGIQHWRAFLHVLKYLRGTQEIGLWYSREGETGLIAYSDADWGNCRETRRSTSGFLAQLHGCLVFWKTRKQPSVSISTAEAEYKSLCDLTSELLWFRQLCHEANIFLLDSAITIWEDNQSCINIANGDCNFNNKRMKHVDIQLHFVKEAIQSNLIILQYAPTTEMLADFLTKSVPKPTLVRALARLRIFSLGVRGGVEKQSHNELRLVNPSPKTLDY